MRAFGLFMDRWTAKFPPLSWLTHALIALPCIGLVALFGPLAAPAAFYGYIKGEELWFKYLLKQWHWTDWVDVLPVPLWLLILWQPWTTPSVVFAFREARQMRARYRAGQKMLWVDHVMDVLAPGLAGWWLLR